MKFRLINAMVLSAALSGNVLADLNDGLVAYYPFNGNAKDASGNGNDGTVNGATLTEDRFGNKESAYIFDGNNSYIQSNISINLAEGITYSAWVFVQNRESNHANLISINNRSFSFFQLSGQIELCVDKCLEHHSISAVKDKQWQHFVITINNGVAKVFLNFKLVKTLNTSTSLANLKNVSLYLGGENGSNYNLTGMIDDVRIYNRALSSQEIQQLYTITLETNISPKNSGTITKSPDKTSYSPNEEVTLTAKPAKGYKFKQWQGDASGSEATITIKMNGNQNVTAVFEEEEDEQPPIEISSKAIYDSKTKTLSLEGILVPYIDEFTGKETDNKGIFDAQLAEKTKLVFELIPWSINFKEMFEGEDTSSYILYHYETRSVDIPCFEVTTIAHIGDGIEGEAIYYKDVTMKQRHVDYPIFHVENMTETDSCN